MPQVELCIWRASDLTSAVFICALTCFVSRKCLPKLVISDNAKTFRSLDTKHFMARHRITQRFILPATSWWGGFYERLVWSVKLSLRKSLGKGFLRYEELETVLCQVEAVINSRSLTYISSDNLIEPLTPFPLLFGRNVSIISSDVSCKFKTGEAAKNSYEHLKRVLDGQWKIFNSSYINELRQQHIYRSSNGTSASKFPSLGDVVLIKRDTPLPRQKWRLGKVEKLIRGRDGNVRGVKLVVSSNEGSRTVCHRPLQKSSLWKLLKV